MRKHLLLVVSVIAIGAFTDTAEAVIGRPLTPVSYAGVARRTTRRAVYAGAATGGAYYGAPVVRTTAVVSTLPTGCASISTATGVYYQCGGARYEPYYSGGTVVYRHY